MMVDSVTVSELASTQSLIDAGLISADDVEASRHDNVATADENGRIRGGSGDDIFQGQDGVAETFSFDGRDDRNDEGHHVDVVQNFTLGEDALSFRVDGGYFGDLGLGRNGNQASLDSAADFIDLLVHINSLTGDSREGLDRGGNERHHDSFVAVVGDEEGNENIVIRIDDTDHREDYEHHRRGFVTDDLTIVFEDFEEDLAAQAAIELGFDSESSRHDSVVISDGSGARLRGGDGDNLFILSDNADTVQLDDRDTNNDEGDHVNVIAGFDLIEDSLSFRFDGGFFDGSNQGTYTGATGLLQLLSYADVLDIPTGDLALSFQSLGGGGGRDPLVVVFDDITLDDVIEESTAHVFETLVESGVTTWEDIANSKQDNVIVAEGGTTKNSDGDDLIIASTLEDRFFFDSRDANNDEGDHVDVIVGGNSADSLGFRIDGGFFEGFELRSINNNQANVGFDELDILADFLNDPSREEGDLSEAYYDAGTDSVVFVIDDSPANNGDELTFVLYGVGDVI